MSRSDGPFKILEKISTNGYQLQLPPNMGNLSSTFNVGDLLPHLHDKPFEYEEVPSQEGNEDARASQHNQTKDNIIINFSNVEEFKTLLI